MRRVAILVFTLHFLAITTGVGAYTLSCLCEQKFEVSLTAQQHQCATKHLQTPKPHPCCIKKALAAQGKTQHFAPKPCCDFQYKIIKLSNPYTKTDAPAQPFFAQIYALPVGQFVGFITPKKEVFALDCTDTHKSPPRAARPFGRALRCRLQTWLC